MAIYLRASWAERRTQARRLGTVDMYLIIGYLAEAKRLGGRPQADYRAAEIIFRRQEASRNLTGRVRQRPTKGL